MTHDKLQATLVALSQEHTAVCRLLAVADKPWVEERFAAESAALAEVARLQGLLDEAEGKACDWCEEHFVQDRDTVGETDNGPGLTHWICDCCLSKTTRVFARHRHSPRQQIKQLQLEAEAAHNGELGAIADLDTERERAAKLLLRLLGQKLVMVFPASDSDVVLINIGLREALNVSLQHGQLTESIGKLMADIQRTMIRAEEATGWTPNKAI